MQGAFIGWTDSSRPVLLRASPPITVDWLGSFKTVRFEARDFEVRFSPVTSEGATSRPDEEQRMFLLMKKLTGVSVEDADAATYRLFV
jgi:hypothetical protein